MDEHDYGDVVMVLDSLPQQAFCLTCQCLHLYPSQVQEEWDRTHPPKDEASHMTWNTATPESTSP